MLSFGRTPNSYHQALVRAFHRMDSPHLYLHSPLGNLSGPSVTVERAMLFKLLHRARIALAFHLFVEPQGNRPRSMMVTSRWLEALLSGTVVAGRRPESRMADEMLAWKNSTVELSTNPEVAREELQALLKDDDALAAQGQINSREVLARHDWRYRIEELCHLHSWEVPNTLKAELTELHVLLQAQGST